MIYSLACAHAMFPFSSGGHIFAFGEARRGYHSFKWSDTFEIEIQPLSSLDRYVKLYDLGLNKSLLDGNFCLIIV
jgi:hypothetical protein